jgi:membrane protein involved in colicin uptake
LQFRRSRVNFYVQLSRKKKSINVITFLECFISYFVMKGIIMKKLLLQQLLLLSVATFGAPLFAADGADTPSSSPAAAVIDTAAETKALEEATEAKKIADQKLEGAKAAAAEKAKLLEKATEAKTAADKAKNEYEKKDDEEDKTESLKTAATQAQTEFETATSEDAAAKEKVTKAEEAVATAEIKVTEAQAALDAKAPKAKPSRAPAPSPLLSTLDEGNDNATPVNPTPTPGNSAEWTDLQKGGIALGAAVVTTAVGLGIRSHYKKQVKKLIEENKDVSSMGFFAIMAA